MKTYCQVLKEIDEEVFPDIGADDELVWIKSKDGEPTVRKMFEEMVRELIGGSTYGGNLFHRKYQFLCGELCMIDYL